MRLVHEHIHKARCIIWREAAHVLHRVIVLPIGALKVPEWQLLFLRSFSLQIK